MKTAAVLLGLSSSLSMAAPANVQRTELGTYPIDSSLVERLSILPAVCTGTTPLCCASDVLGNILSLNCVAPAATPITVLGFQAACLIDGGRLPRCCTLSVGGSALLCRAPGV
ncbi:hypothetical protein CORC01_10859 [Colletotrichum orchidophilum]|uniref:Hydrophobin n=1 Tax=Colletotrichum orchidophilum TaxID=1209926 RepID=A0A1G4AXE9_9PEZI|nr:uncharacterized protein CORC01_10859 [Colletotrichum orchidophilum]OHE93838.1 hypothetical protein CORC01_10859 [Colletotrichum orchidophilum]